VILRNKCLDRLRREKPLQPLDESAAAERPDEGPSPLEGTMAADDARRLKGCVDHWKTTSGNPSCWPITRD
jgi:DNA-directed RNA polymerase specialized sigma24 family protein